MKRRDFLTRSLAGVALTAVGTSCHRVEKCSEINHPNDRPSDHYTRMFPELARQPSLPNSRTEKGLEALGNEMRGASSNTLRPPAAGYTYLGQFIDHDLTSDLTPLIRAHPNAGRIRNFRTPFLDLDHVYGGGPSLSPFLYENNRAYRDKERFLVGETSCGCKNDLPRNPQGIALVGDPRQDENLVIAQLHVGFLKFHNRVIEDLEQGWLSSVGPCEGTLFDRARRLVVWHYQHIVLHDFLAEMIDPTVFDGVPKRAAGADQCDRAPFRIPIEFNAAAFRFGHSMVRDLYGFYNRDHSNVGLKSHLLYQTGAGGGAVPCLPDEWVINWTRFFESGEFSLNHAHPIDTNIAEDLHNLETHTIKLFNASSGSESAPTQPAISLPVRTLVRGARMGLPSGQDIANALRVSNPLTEADMTKHLSQETLDVLTNYGFLTDTPLWFYILKEAEMRRDGQKLGELGSRIVADVVTQALRADPNSYLSIDPNWKPHLDGKPVCTMMHRLQYAHHLEVTNADSRNCPDVGN